MTDQERYIQSCINYMDIKHPEMREVARQVLQHILFASNQHSCNDCKVKNCNMRPELGKSAIVNCYQWEGKNK